MLGGEMCLYLHICLHVNCLPVVTFINVFILLEFLYQYIYFAVAFNVPNPRECQRSFVVMLFDSSAMTVKPLNLNLMPLQVFYFCSMCFASTSQHFLTSL